VFRIGQKPRYPTSADLPADRFVDVRIFVDRTCLRRRTLTCRAPPFGHSTTGRPNGNQIRDDHGNRREGRDTPGAPRTRFPAVAAIERHANRCGIDARFPIKSMFDVLPQLAIHPTPPDASTARMMIDRCATTMPRALAPSAPDCETQSGSTRART
jgi:hypothetical protein